MIGSGVYVGCIAEQLGSAANLPLRQTVIDDIQDGST